MGNIGKATEPRSINNNQWQPTQVTDIYLTVLCTPFINRFMYRQHVPVYDLEKRRGDCLIKWLIMLGFIDLRGPRVCRRSTPVLFGQVGTSMLILWGWWNVCKGWLKNPFAVLLGEFAICWMVSLNDVQYNVFGPRCRMIFLISQAG